MATRYDDVTRNLDDQIIEYDEMTHMVVMGKDGHNSGELALPKAIAIEENANHIYVTQWYPVRVSIFSQSGEFINNFTHDHIESPYGIAIHRNNVYVTDGIVHGVFHFKIEAYMRLETELIGMGSADGKFNYPQQLTVSANGDVFVADYNNNRIQILDESLHFQRSIKHDSMHYPVDVKLTINEVYVLSTDSPCLHLFSHAGEKIRSFITRGTRMQVTEAHFFCLDAHKNLIIGDVKAHSVKVFSPDGILLHTINKILDSPLHIPEGLALTKQLKLAILAPENTFKLVILSP